MVEVAGWKMAAHFGHPESEKTHLSQGSLIVDWSHIGKIHLRGKKAAETATKIDSRASALKSNATCRTKDVIVLRVMEDEFFILLQPGLEKRWISQLDQNAVAITDYTGAYGCFVLAGARTYEILERSTAVDMQQAVFPDYTVIRASLHFTNCMLYRTPDWDLLMVSRDFAEFLYDALMDVGHGVGLKPSGLDVLPVKFD